MRKGFLLFLENYISKCLNIGESLNTNHTKKEDVLFLRSLHNPVDDIDRSYNQYLCQKWSDKSFFVYVCMNFISLILLIPFSMKYLVDGLFLKKKQHFEGALTRTFLKKVLPDNFNGDVISQKFSKGSLQKEDCTFLIKIIIRHPFSFYFIFKTMCRIAAYSDLIHQYSPNVIFCSCEYSFTSSILTLYCEMEHVKHVNIMHGEKLFNLRDAFCHFDTFIVWDDFYVNLFHELRADCTKYEIRPIKIEKTVDVNNLPSSCTYYLQKQNKEELKRIKNVLDKLNVPYKVRPHPLYQRFVKEFFYESQIENSEKIDIYKSLSECGIAVSLFSTVLNQACVMGIPYVIDDISNPKLFHFLQERDYIMLHKSHRLLSEIVKNKG